MHNAVKFLPLRLPYLHMPRPKSKAQLFAWSPAGELIWHGLLSTFSRAQGIDARDLFSQLLVTQATTGREPELLPFQGHYLSLTRNLRPGIGQSLH